MDWKKFHLHVVQSEVRMFNLKTNDADLEKDQNPFHHSSVVCQEFPVSDDYREKVDFHTRDVCFVKHFGLKPSDERETD